ncbi:MAG: acetyl-CoA carboxylase biotin carboxylase subunit [Caldilineales bacterium]|nr:acetyl-CoA carboxylase biotin carboxylase subunit [Caldilineales bacterium]
MFKKVLIANRGEIAVRILRACQERGLRTVAVYSDADRNALHVRYADEAYRIGPPPARESYLRIDKIIEVAKRCGADAIHPGYGFLSENDDFAQACQDEGITFIGPPPEAMRLMGDKVTARRTMIAAGVPVVPGSMAGLRDDEIRAEAERIGYPVLIKASAGGGGKGMRIVRSPDQLESALGAARREALAAFGDDTVYLEKLIERPRHIEIQVLADRHGNVIHLGERECSIQRRHQKLIEESPSVAVDEALRARMGEVAVRAAQAVGYVNAGTLEFLLDQQGNFYFLEMNTRLQVEHPVTEMVTGVDIVKEMLAIAAGRRLRWKQEDIRHKGWAIECRITAEDPINNFMPCGGVITTLQEPTGPGVRVESGIYEGFEVSLYYDPMIAKLIVWGESRAEAILRMRRALNEYRIGGIKTSIPFHQQMMNSTQFMWGTFDTNFLEDRFAVTYIERPEMELGAAIAAALVTHERAQAAATMHQDEQPVVGSPWKRGLGWKHVGRF